MQHLGEPKAPPWADTDWDPWPPALGLSNCPENTTFSLTGTNPGGSVHLRLHYRTGTWSPFSSLKKSCLFPPQNLSTVFIGSLSSFNSPQGLQALLSPLINQSTFLLCQGTHLLWAFWVPMWSRLSARRPNGVANVKMPWGAGSCIPSAGKAQECLVCVPPMMDSPTPSPTTGRAGQGQACW